MDQVEEIKSKVDIVSIISEYVQLSKAGRNYKGLCPFHQERTPSFMVSPELQIFKCFGCGNGGDSITFLEKFEGLEFYDALKILALKAGVKLKTPSGQNFSEKEKLEEANETAVKFYNYILLNHKGGVGALNYLTKERHISLEVVKKFNLGFSLDIPDALSKFLIDKKGFNMFELEKAGLLVRSGGRNFDRFRGRIIFPLYDHRSVCVGLAGRILPSIEAKLPKDMHLGKYVNSPETPIYHKSKILFGLNVTKNDIKKLGSVIIVEGEIDFLSVWQAGVKNIVAIKGTALTQDQIKILSRFTDTLILALDSDIAGDAAARRGISIAQGYGLKVKVLMPSLKYKDPDEYVRANPEDFKKSILNAVSVWDFLIDSTFSKFDSFSGEGKSGIGRELVPILSSIEDKIIQSHYISLVSKRLNVPVDAVNSEILKLEGKGALPSNKERPSPLAVDNVDSESKTRAEILEDRLLSLGFQIDPSNLLEKRELFSTLFVKKILDALESYLSKIKNFQLKEFVKGLPNELSSRFSEVILEGDIETYEDEKEIEKEINLLVRELKIFNLKEKLRSLTREIAKLEEKESEKNVDKLTKEFSIVSRELAEIENEP